MLNKIETAIRVIKTYGLLEVFLVIFRKTHKADKQKELLIDVPVLDTKQMMMQLRKSLGVDLRLLEQAELDFNTFMDRSLLVASRDRKSFFGPEYDAGPNMTKLLYLVCRVIKPNLVVETGVASGVSSNCVLDALQTNEAGKLISIDITENVGELIEARLQTRWNLKILPRTFRRRAFVRFIKTTPGIEIFIHDSDHSEVWQKIEFLTVMNLSPATKILIFDDITQGVIHQAKSHFPDLEMFLIKEDNKTAAFFVRHSLR